MPVALCTTPDSVETELIDWIRTDLKPGEVLYDIGANVGAYSLYTAKHHKGAVKVYAFEPAAPTIPLLIHNIVRNGCAGTVMPMTFPLSAQADPGHVQLPHQADARLCQARLRRGGRLSRPKPFSRCSRNSWSRPRLDQLVNEYHLPPPNHIKIDVDGLEFEILSGGGRRCCKSGVVKSLFFEVGGRFDMQVLTSFLASCGFAQKSAFQHDNTSNVIFVRGETARPLQSAQPSVPKNRADFCANLCAMPSPKGVAGPPQADIMEDGSPGSHFASLPCTHLPLDHDTAVDPPLADA